ncbi:MAG: hypothetical protein U0270_01530 [Labilithrix sp.]
MLDVLHERAPALGRMVWSWLLYVWRRDSLFLALLLAFELFCARHTFDGGIWADNDSVCHYAYLRHLLEEIYPQTGTFLAYSPRFDLGVPFLLYNTPPGTYVLSGIVTTVLHVTALTGLKITVTAGFLSVPVLGYFIAKTFDDAPPDSPKFVAMVLGLLSSELWGLEFFFRNGMLNPALGVPFLLATLYFFRRTQTSPFPQALRHIAFGGFFFACTACTHLLSTYMLSIALGAFVLGRRLKDWGHDVLRLGGLLCVGGALAGFWLVPSAAFAAKEDAAYTWLRRPTDLVASFLDGSLLSSCFYGFFPSFVNISNVGIVTVAMGLLGILIGVIARRHIAPRVALFVFVLGFWIMVGPTWSFLIKWLPGYERLLWYRFVTLAQLGWFMLAGFGAAYVADLDKRFAPYNRLLLAAGFGWAVLSLGGRADKIETATHYPEFTTDLDQIVAWLKEHGDRRGRVYDEFLGQAVIQPPSVNYPRHMTPTLSGFDEVSGWIYENNIASQVLMKKGAFWFSPFPMIEEAPRYNVKYIVAGSPHFVRALSLDPRWRSVLGQRNLVLFENTAYDPTLAEGRGFVAKTWTQRYLRGGGYQYDFELGKADVATGVTADRPFVVKVGYLPYFTVTADDVIVPTRPSADGLLEVDLPAGAMPARLRCVWDVTPLRLRGNMISLAGIGIAVLLVAASFVKKIDVMKRASRPLALVGIAAAGLAVVGAFVRDRNVDLSPIGFGVRGGIVPFLDPHRLKVGIYDDERASGIVHTVTAAWGPRITAGREPARRLEHPEGAALVIALTPNRASSLVITGEPPSAPVELELSAPGGATMCRLSGRVGAPIALPKACAAPDPHDASGALPGATRTVTVKSESPLVVTSVAVDSSIRVIEAESLTNSHRDSGYEAFYSFGPAESFPSNGLLMITDVKKNEPVDLGAEPGFQPGRYDVWLLHRTYHPRFDNTRAEVIVLFNDKPVGSASGNSRIPHDFWERDAVYEWMPIGPAEVQERSTLKLRIVHREDTVAGIADIDSVALVPRD